ncbi:MAG: HAMP domain-containing protein [Betaproteobacteria bacterium]|nr:HAMP domain-containing protein [Betaproteobacteria bacterium]
MITHSLTRRLLLTVVLAALAGGAIWTLLVAAHGTARVERLSSYVAQTFAANAAEIIKSHGDELLTVLRSIQRRSVSASGDLSSDDIVLAGRIQHTDAALHIALYAPTGQLLQSIQDPSVLGSDKGVATEVAFVHKLGSGAGLLAREGTALNEPRLRVAAGLTLTPDSVLLASVDFQLIARQIEAMYSGQVLVVDLDGRSLLGRPPEGLSRLISTAIQGPRYQTVSFESVLYEIARTPLDDLTGRRLGNLFLVRADSGQLASENLLGYAVALVVVVGFALFAGLVLAVLRRELAPLADVERLTRSLSRHDLHAPAAGASRPDELGRINEAVELLREAAVERDRLAFANTATHSRERQMIEGELRRLAEMLDDTERVAVLKMLSSVVVTEAASAKPTNGTIDTPLARAFQFMSDRVKAQQTRLTTLLAERTADLDTVRQALAERSDLFRLREEVAVARSLQLSMLPDKNRLDPIRDQIELAALTRPAKEVGGDSYDFQLFDSGRRLMFLVCDSSGKGIPAAMFVLTTKTLVTAASEAFGGPAAGLAAANLALARSNDALSFTTLFIGLLDLETGLLTYSSAGHNPPLLRRASGGLEQLDQATGLVLGVIEDAVYDEARVQMLPGDTLVLYTDGITEAHDAQQQMFGLDRLETICRETPISPVPNLIDRMMSSVDEFAGSTPQYDDITLLVLRYCRKSA